MTRVTVYKGKGNRGCTIVLLIFVVLCIAPVLCVTALVSAAAGGVFGEAEVKTATYNEPENGAESADIEIKLGVGKLELGALNDSNDLLDANISYVGGIAYDVSGDSDRRITLRQTQGDYDFFGFLSLLDININTTDSDLVWAINLSRDVPLELDIEGGVGGFDLDLSDLQIADLRLESGTGETNITLPEPNESYRVDINGGVGSTSINVPEGVAVRLEANQGLGEVNVPSSFERISGSDNDDSSQEGVWETANFDDADVQITIVYDGGVGQLTLREN